MKGGNHVNYVAKQITDAIAEEFLKKNKQGSKVQANHVKNRKNINKTNTNAIQT